MFVDVDKNTKFEKGGGDYCLGDKITNGQEKSLTVALDSEFFGSAAWYLEITDEDGNIVASSTGLSKIVNNNVSKSEINVLQVQTMAEGQGAKSWQSTDTLYFDMSHRQLTRLQSTMYLQIRPSLIRVIQRSTLSLVDMRPDLVYTNLIQIQMQMIIIRILQMSFLRIMT